MVARVLGRLPLLGGTLISDGEHRSIWGGPPLPKWQILFVAAFAMAGIAAALLAPRSRGESAGQVAWRRATALTALLFAAVMLVSRLTIAQHHFVTIVPIAALAAVLGIRRVASGGPARAAFGSAAVLFAVLCLSWNARSMVGLRRTGGQGSWSDAIESVAEVMRVETPGTAARALTWGLANNVFVLTRGIAAPRDSSAGATEEMSELRRSWSDEISEGGWFLVGAGTSAAKAGFQKAWNTARPPTRRWTFRERDGTFYAELVHVLPKDAGSVSGASRAIDNRP
jgi:hypothetical protein